MQVIGSKHYPAIENDWNANEAMTPAAGCASPALRCAFCMAATNCPYVPPNMRYSPATIGGGITLAVCDEEQPHAPNQARADARFGPLRPCLGAVELTTGAGGLMRDSPNRTTMPAAASKMQLASLSPK